MLKSRSIPAGRDENYSTGTWRRDSVFHWLLLYLGLWSKSLQRFMPKSSILVLFVLRFYGPVNPMGSCRARSVYLTTRLLGRLESSKQLTSIVHILSPETDNCPSWISGRERMTVENISWSISTKECCRPRRGLNPQPPGLQSDGASNWATEAGADVWFLGFQHCIKVN